MVKDRYIFTMDDR